MNVHGATKAALGWKLKMRFDALHTGQGRRVAFADRFGLLLP